jgi:hypothetical protein
MANEDIKILHRLHTTFGSYVRALSPSRPRRQWYSISVNKTGVQRLKHLKLNETNFLSGYIFKKTNFVAAKFTLFRSYIFKTAANKVTYIISVLISFHNDQICVLVFKPLLKIYCHIFQCSGAAMHTLTRTALCDCLAGKKVRDTALCVFYKPRSLLHLKSRVFYKSINQRPAPHVPPTGMKP